MAAQPGKVATCPASQPTAPDFSWGFQFHLSSGTRSSTFLVFSISCSNSPSMAWPILIAVLLTGIRGRNAGVGRGRTANWQPAKVAHRRTKSKCDRGRFSRAPLACLALPRARKLPNATSTHSLLSQRLGRPVPLLQETRRACHRTVPRRGPVHNSRCRIQFDRNHREAYGREHALALDQLSDDRRRKARPQPRL